MHVSLVILEHGRRGREIVIRRPEIIIGRAKGCKVRITSSEVSRQHCRLRIDGTDVSIQDLGSSNGTYLNGKLCQGLTAVRPQDQVRVGPVDFLVDFDPLAPEPAIPASSAELTIEAEDIIIMDVEEAEDDPATVAKPPVQPIKTRRAAPLAIRSEREWAEAGGSAANPADERLPWAELAESELPPAPAPPAQTEELPLAEPDESGFQRASPVE